VRKFSIPCDFGRERSSFDFYLGEPAGDLHPLKYQQLWLLENRGGKIIPELRESLEKVLRLAMGTMESLAEGRSVPSEESNSETEEPAPGAGM
jgi:hypothetical protein